MAHGKLIVLEGIDGSGKSAHYRRICEILFFRAMTTTAAR